MKKLIVSLCCMVALASMALAGSYTLVRLPSPGFHTITTGGTGKVVQIEVYDSTVADGTVQLYKLTPGGSASNLQYTVTCASGAAVVGLTSTNTFYVSAGDVIYRTGTATDGAVRLILQ